jgi:hypothetical protein
MRWRDLCRDNLNSTSSRHQVLRWVVLPDYGVAESLTAFARCIHHNADDLRIDMHL